MKKILLKRIHLQEVPIVPEFMLKCWNAYAESIKNEKPRFSFALKSIEPVIKENQVHRDFLQQPVTDRCLS